jgi:transposase-like protein
MKLLAFQERFSTEEACVEYLVQVRWPQGYVCPACGGKEHWYKKERRTFDCKACRKQYSVTSETMFHKTQSDLREWFWTIYLMCQSKKGISTLELQRLLGAPDYRRVEHMQNRIRQAMENREGLYSLEGFVEVDEGFFGGKRSGGKRGKGSPGKTQVLVQASVDGDRNLQYAKMTVIQDGQGDTIRKQVQATVEKSSTLYTDGNPAYTKLSRQGYSHLPKVMRFPEDCSQHLPWVHILISNAKRFILGTHHSVQNLQHYLHEFCYRLNRRNFGTAIFSRFLLAAVSYNPQPIRL